MKGKKRKQKIGRYAVIAIIGFVFLAVFVFVVPSFSRVRDNMLGTVLPAVLDYLTNAERQQNNVSALTPNPLLSQAAQLKAQDMAEKQYFAHTSPEGIKPWHWLDAVGYTYDYAGDNLAINFTDSKDVTDAWMRSPMHRSNILKSAYTEIGTGVATGTYQGREAVFIVQMYARRQ
jgi:uncharacterized protein YkwD